MHPWLHHHWRQLAPALIRRHVSTVRLRRTRALNANRTSEEVFSEIYRARVWGIEKFDSGSGSRGVPADAYTDLVRSLISQFGVRSAVDIGCGDFRVAGRFADTLESYVGVDVARPVVERNTELFSRTGLTFAHLDAARADPPDADLCLVRQVLQHLSNHQISAILERCRKYPLVLITEHRPPEKKSASPNIDKPHGPDTRLDRNSWVDIRRAPFLCTPVQQLLEVPVDPPQYHAGESIVSMLWRPVAS